MAISKKKSYIILLLYTLHKFSVYSVFKSDNSYRIAVYFIFIPILICLIALLVESLLSDTGAHGLNTLFTFDWENLLELKVGSDFIIIIVKLLTLCSYFVL